MIKYKGVEVFWLEDNENVFLQGPKSELIKFLEEFLISDSNRKNTNEHPLDLKKMEEVGITYSNLDEFLSNLIVSFEDEEDCSLCKKAIEKNDVNYLNQIKNKNVYYFISTGEPLSNNLYSLQIIPFSEKKNLFYFEGIQDELDFLKKIGKICYGTKEFYKK